MGYLPLRVQLLLFAWQVLVVSRRSGPGEQRHVIVLSDRYLNRGV